MAEETAPEPIGRRIRYGARVHRAFISVVVLAAGALLTILAIGYFTPLMNLGFFQTINNTTDAGGANYNLVFVIVGPIVLIIGLYLVLAYYVARRKFEHLMVTKSKAEFLRNIPELEEILWDLTPADEIRYQDKRAELRVRR